MAKETGGPVILEVYNPTGALEIAPLHAPRLDTLEGKTICELSDAMWEDHRTFPLIRKLWQERFPTAKIIPYSEFPSGVVGVDSDEAASLVKERGCDAAIVGNAA